MTTPQPPSSDNKPKAPQRPSRRPRPKAKAAASAAPVAAASPAAKPTEQAKPAKPAAQPQRPRRQAQPARPVAASASAKPAPPAAKHASAHAPRPAEQAKPAAKKPAPHARPAPAPHPKPAPHAHGAAAPRWPGSVTPEHPFAGHGLNKKQQTFLREVYDRHQLEYLEKRLGVNFRDKSLLISALTHPSFVGDHPDCGFDHYQRLEFLGDSVLSLYLARTLYLRFPTFAEGPITRIKSAVEQDAGLAPVANEIGLGRFLVLGRSEMLTGGMTKTSILAAATEALIGALYLDGGPAMSDQVLDRLIGPRVPKELSTEEIASDPKSKLQDILQKRFKSSPLYHIAQTEGPEHDRTYAVQVIHKGRKLGRGVGRSKKEAEQEAARDTLANFMDYLQSGG